MNGRRDTYQPVTDPHGCMRGMLIGFLVTIILILGSVAVGEAFVIWGTP